MTDRRTRTARGATEREAAVTAEPALPPSQAQLLALQRTAGNHAVAALLRREPAAIAAAPDELAKEAMRADADQIVELLKSQVLFAGDEQQISRSSSAGSTVTARRPNTAAAPARRC